MRKKLVVVLSLILAIALLPACSSQTQEDTKTCEKILDGVYDLGVKRVDNEKEALEYYEKLYSGQIKPGETPQDGGCSIVVKTLSDGRTVAARNMDFIISNKPAFVIRTEIPGQNKTVGLFYSTQKSSPDISEVEENGTEAISDHLYGLAPYNCTDYINDKGLYVEYDMRTYEGSKFVNTGTNPDAEKSVPLILLPSFIARYCDDVPSAIEYVKNNINVYSADAPGAFGYGYACMLADAKGNYGLLEIANNEIVFLDKQGVQSNYYITEKFNKQEEMKAGLGRYEVLSKGLPDADSDEDMFELIKKVNYFQMYNKYPEERTFDSSSEWVGDDPELKLTFTNKWIEENKEQFNKYDRECVDKTLATLNSGKSIEEIRAEFQGREVWNSTFTLLADPAAKTFKVRFFEDDNLITTIGLDK